MERFLPSKAFLSHMGGETATFDWPVISFAATIKDLVISRWFGWKPTSVSKGRTSTFPVAVLSHTMSCSLLMPSSSAIGASSCISGISALVYLVRRGLASPSQVSLVGSFVVAASLARIISFSWSSTSIAVSWSADVFGSSSAAAVSSSGSSSCGFSGQFDSGAFAFLGTLLGGSVPCVCGVGLYGAWGAYQRVGGGGW